MKTIFKIILQFYLKYITKLVLFIYRPKIIAIAGSTNKTFVKEQIHEELKNQGIKARSNPKSFNTEIGLPLAILNLPSGYNSYKKWVPIILTSIFKIFDKNFPEYLVLEMGVSDPGDVRHLLSIIKPKILVITDINQRYLESFDDMDDLVGEYEEMISRVKKLGLIILNSDNPRIKKFLRIKTAEIITFGINDGANWQAIEIIKDIYGQNIKISHNDIINNYKINRYGKHHIYALLIRLIIKEYVQNNKKN